MENFIEISGIVVTVFLAFIGYIITYLNDKRIHSREEELAQVNERLEKLYGPLYFHIVASDTAFKSLLQKLGREHLRPDPSESDLKEWRNWAINILMPNNRIQKDIIYGNAYLTLEDEPPECFVNFVRHVSEMEAIVNKWEEEDYSENFPVIGFPEDMQAYVHTTYLELKNRQKELIGSSKRKASLKN